MTLAYDNMCYLVKLKASSSPLPFQSPLDKMWINVNKIIDVFQFSNHISPVCRQKYSPETGIHRPENKHALSCHVLSILSVQCQNSIIFSLFTIWLLDAMNTLLSVISMAENLYCLCHTDFFMTIIIIYSE